MLTLPWTAKFTDGSYIEQYTNKCPENLFKSVLDRQDELELFYLVNKLNNDVFIVDLINGCISKTTTTEQKIEPRADMLRKDQYKYRLIYFREVAKHFDANLKPIGNEEIVYFIGFQYTDENDKNHKRMIKIQDDGRWVVN